MSKFDIKAFKGVIPAVLTVFDKEENIDEVGMRQLVSFLIDKGVNGLYLTGSTGEGFTMTSEERKKVVEIVIDETAGRVPVVVHVGAIGTKISIDLAKHAESVGADGISSVPPFYWKFNENQIIKYYEDIANSCSIPMIVYNVPLVGLLGMNAIKRLAKIENVKGIKYTALSQYEITQIKDEVGEEFLVYSGADEMAMSGLIAGADGIVGSFYNIMPELFINIYDAVKNKDLDEAQRLQKQAVEVIMYALQLPSFYAGMKVILKWMGINAGYCRRPFENLTEEDEVKFKEGFKKLKETYDLKGIDFIDAI
ncbi:MULTISPECIES: dihydrodipicolinate synthase family protein [Clostridium]|uniref:Dihydrodipicolinate synthetase family protein n=1 Tax=Clostridium butyricum E4 str. BoNT E BL5262 TaxID=632245 RepID=C4ILY9_CLOBU|nr:MULTISPECIES: dihydrodipicolinate synthase family protein [Clostridium]MDU4853828.1 dihydrodipicolinate synthase family protein [Clostridioides difficile]APF21741.1 dihydrodipicolinate synthetase family protein [Clostridium butyricum]EDT74670.1 N-acetylneuraminate lyase 2 [Clostridium butyricum 5521]EEP52788.1 Dihydrodipicolinate synthetase family protein [Clostridium butyricum E4 str. BoNT E BL5262]MDB2159560.1 dihydrodipicolinate synthase family protein [Clostridium butyricum]